MTSIAAIVCAHTLERWQDINTAIASLQSQTRPPDEIICAIDNNAELFQIASDTFAPAVTVVHNTGNRGVSPARNVAAHASSSDVLAYLDDDARADERWIEYLLPWYDDETVVGVGGTANPLWDGGDGPSWFPASFNWVVGCSHSGISNEPAQVRNFIGCNMSIRRTAWQAVGGFYDGLGRVGADGGGGDETDFCIRVTDTVGGRIMNDPGAVVSHRVPESRQTLRYLIKRCRSEGTSKALISARAGSDQALSAERQHLLHELPRSFFAGVADTLRGDPSGIGRSGAIVIGTAATALGYAQGLLARRTKTEPNSLASSESDTTESAADHGHLTEAFTPIQVVTLDLDDPSHELPAGEPLFVIVRKGPLLLGIDRQDRAPADLVQSLQRRFEPAADAPRNNPPIEGSVAVVIATRDRSEALKRCLASMDELVQPPAQIIVVDNAPSDDSTKNLVTELNAQVHGAAQDAPALTYVRCDTPGLANAHNAALPFITSDIVAFTDDDVIVDPYWLGQLLVGFASAPDIVCVTGAIMPAELETWPQDWVERSSGFTKGFTPRVFRTDGSVSDPLFPFTAGSMGSGANMAFTTKWLVDTGGFDQALGAGTTAKGGDDLRAFYDVVTSGAALCFTPHAIVFHHHHRTPTAIDNQCYGYGAGLSAYLMSVVLDDPASLLKMARQAPQAFRHARATTAGVPAHEASFPGEGARVRLQRRGMLAGPFRYVRSRR